MKPQSDEDDGELLARVRLRAERVQRWLRDGEPTLTRQLAAVGVLGWIIVLPLLAGIAAGRWLDRWLATGILLTGAMLLVGLVVGCWSAWRWMHDK